MTIWRTCVSKSHRIEGSNHGNRLLIRVLHGSRKTFRLRMTKNNLLNSRFTKNKWATHASREYPCANLIEWTPRLDAFALTRVQKNEQQVNPFTHGAFWQIETFSAWILARGYLPMPTIWNEQIRADIFFKMYLLSCLRSPSAVSLSGSLSPFLALLVFISLPL